MKSGGGGGVGSEEGSFLPGLSASHTISYLIEYSTGPASGVKQAGKIQL